jgi:glycosyltransferase involved in cell wall biosynthesis
MIVDRSPGALRVLHVVTTGERRGAEMFAADLIRWLNGVGAEQRVGLLRGSDAPPAGYEAPTQVVGSPQRRRLGSLDPRAVVRLRSLVRSWRPHIVQAHGGDPLIHATLAGAGSGGRLVYRRIGLSTGRARHRLGRLSYGALIRRSSRIIAVADAVRRETIELFRVAPQDVMTIPRGVDRRRLRPTGARDKNREALGIAPGSPVVLTLGALSWEKDPLAHLEVMDLVRRELPDAVHLIAGEGPMRGAVEGRILELGSDRLTRVLGSREDVGDLLSCVDLLLLASRVEGMPGCLIEAGLAGLPAVAYDVAGVSEVVVEAVTGFVVPQGDVAALARRAVQVLSGPEIGRRLGMDARARCEQRFEISAIAPRYLSIYEEVLR